MAKHRLTIQIAKLKKKNLNKSYFFTRTYFNSRDNKIKFILAVINTIF